MGSASDVADRGQNTLASVGDTVSDAPSMVAERTKGSPLPPV